MLHDDQRCDYPVDVMGYFNKTFQHINQIVYAFPNRTETLTKPEIC